MSCSPVTDCGKRDLLGWDNAINLANKHAMQYGLPTSNEILNVLQSVDPSTTFKVGDGKTVSVGDIQGAFDLNIGAIAALTALIPGVGPIIGPALALLGGFVDFNKDSGAPGTDFYCGIEGANWTTNLNSGAWALIASEVRNNPEAKLATSSTLSDLTGLKKGHIGMCLSPCLFEKYSAFIASNLRPDWEQPYQIMQIANQIKQDQILILDNQPVPDLTYLPEPNDPDGKNPIQLEKQKEDVLNLGALALGAFLIFKMIK